MNYFFTYVAKDKELRGDAIVVAQGEQKNGVLQIDDAIGANFDIYIDFLLPKKVKCRSLKMTKDNACYCLELPNTINQNVGLGSFQAVCFSGNTIVKTIIVEDIIRIMPSINANTVIEEKSPTLLEELLLSEKAQNTQLAALNASDTAQNTQLAALNASDTAQNTQLAALNASDTAQNTQLATLNASDTAQNTQLATLNASDTAQNTRLGDHDKSIGSHDARLLKCETNIDRLDSKLEVVYYKNSNDPLINWGRPNGLGDGASVTGIDLSGYKYLFVNFQRDRSMVIIIDMTDMNEPNDFFIATQLGTYQVKTGFGMAGCEIIINKAKTVFKVNNMTITDTAGGALKRVASGDNYSIISKISGLK